MQLPAIIDTQKAFSERTFGPGDRTKGVIDHILKELKEIEVAVANGDPVLEEWIDVAILAFDGAWRSGASPAGVERAYLDKLSKNMERIWPDWRTVDPDRAIEHVRT